MYQPRQTPVSRFCDVRGLRHHVSEWPGVGRPIVLLHGYMDCGATFQFLADELRSGRTLIAPDWRGFGRSGWAADGYWFPDYFADLDALLADLAPGDAVDLVGHSMGGNVALMYAGLRPERVRRLVTLEGFGLPGVDPGLAPGRYREWLTQVREPQPATTFPGFDVLAQRLRQRNPRLDEPRADFIARAWAESLDDGSVRLRFDPAHRRVNPVLYRREEAEACWREIRAPVACVTGSESDFPARLRGAADPEAMRRHVRRLETYVIDGAGHMLQHDQPQAVARVIEEFLGREPL
jgi:pimeloyl-ACP methyl ester carboxylesterase